MEAPSKIVMPKFSMQKYAAVSDEQSCLNFSLWAVYVYRDELINRKRNGDPKITDDMLRSVNEFVRRYKKEFVETLVSMRNDKP